jgi:hypothetical protein
MRQEINAPSPPPDRIPQAEARDLIQGRIDGISTWLAENAVMCATGQKHLDEGTAERQYWHYGYLVALRDIQKLLGLSGDALN